MHTYTEREAVLFKKSYILWRRPANSSVSTVTVSLCTKNILHTYVAFHSFDTPLTWNPPTGPVILLLQQLSRLPYFALIIHQGGTSYLLTLGSRRDSVLHHHFPHDSAVTVSQMTFTFQPSEQQDGTKPRSEAFLRRLQFLSQSSISLPNSWNPKIHQRVHETTATFPYPKPDKSSSHHPILLHSQLFLILR